MRSPARTIAVSTPAVIVVAVAWLRLEHPVGPMGRVFALLALALAAAVPTHRLLRLLAAIAAAVAAAHIAVGVDLLPWRLNHPGSGFGLADAFSTLGTRFGNGFSDFYGTHLPFDATVHEAMHELVLSGLFLFALGVTLFVAAGKPVAGALVLLVGAGWPSTLLASGHEVAMGAAILGAALVIFAGLGSRRVPALAIPAAAVVAVAAIVVGSATAARHGLVRWQSWNLAHVATSPSYVGFVWDPQYGGLKFSGRPTTVLQVQSGAVAPTYLRATVLDDFEDDLWQNRLPRPADSLEPAAAWQRRNQTRETVTVAAYADTHLVGGSVPIRFVPEGGAQLVPSVPGFAALNENLPRGFQYTVWSYTHRPTPGELRGSPAQYPRLLREDGLLDVSGSTLPRFGAPDRRALVLARVRRTRALRRYVPLASAAERIAGGARTPYDAVEKLQQWFLSGTFRYSNHPAQLSPALVGFVTKTHAGYCQYFAGAMALMLRYLGVPARVAVGFAGGTYDEKQKVWNVSDREAHAWVEVWFKGYGWLPFDPTPSAPGAAPRSTQAGVLAAGGAGIDPRLPTDTPTSGGPHASPLEQHLIGANGFGSGSHRRNASPGSEVSFGGGHSDRARPMLLLLAGLAAVVGGIVLTKIGFRMTRNARRDPRAVASACRQELASFLLDQRIEAARSATLGELGDVVKREFGVDAEAFVTAATAARFGPADGAAAAALSAKRELRTLLEVARRSLTWRERARGLLSLRSLARPVAVDVAASAGSGIG